MVKFLKRPKKEDEEILFIVPAEEIEDAGKMVEYNGFSSVEEFLRSGYRIALQTYRRKYKR